MQAITASPSLIPQNQILSLNHCAQEDLHSPLSSPFLNQLYAWMPVTTCTVTSILNNGPSVPNPSNTMYISLHNMQVITFLLHIVYILANIEQCLHSGGLTADQLITIPLECKQLLQYSTICVNDEECNHLVAAHCYAQVIGSRKCRSADHHYFS